VHTQAFSPVPGRSAATSPRAPWVKKPEESLAGTTACRQEDRDSLNARAGIILSERGEVYFRFPVSDPGLCAQLSGLLSVDRIADDQVYAYANRDQFHTFLGYGISYELLPPPSSGHYLKSGSVSFDPATFDSYPSYGEYISRMHVLADSFPGICRLDTIGFSVFNRMILAAGITGDGRFGAGKPVFLYTSSIHGDETTGYMLLLRLTDHLLHGYGSDSLVTQLADKLEIWINPLANPDGTYFLGDATVYLATRFNANSVDLNRNFPDPAEGEHPDNQPWQPETTAMMAFMKQHPPDMSANLHSGAEVVNYPWDTWTKSHADEDWFIRISQDYADTVRGHSTDYFLQFEKGITRGVDWYRISGGRQDYVTYFLHGREVTLELSLDKMPPATDMPTYWEYNRKALLQLMGQCLYGLSGKVIDAGNGEPVGAKISLPGHDDDNSWVYSDSLSGTFYRFLKEGTYNLTAEAPGYQVKTIEHIFVPERQSTRLLITMEQVSTGFAGEETPARLMVAGTRIIYFIDRPGAVTLQVFDLTGRQVLPVINRLSAAGRNELELGNSLAPGNYLFRISCHGRSFSYICSFNF
jgi:hypothetical protein